MRDDSVHVSGMFRELLVAVVWLLIYYPLEQHLQGRGLPVRGWAGSGHERHPLLIPYARDAGTTGIGGLESLT